MDLSFNIKKENYTGVEARQRGMLAWNVSWLAVAENLVFLGLLKTLNGAKPLSAQFEKFFWRKILSVIYTSLWCGASRNYVMKLKYVHAMKFWHGAKPFMKWTPGADFKKLGAWRKA